MRDPVSGGGACFFLLFFPVGEDDDRRCGADLTVTRVQIERLWFDQPKRSAGDGGTLCRTKETSIRRKQSSERINNSDNGGSKGGWR
ncbi:hypothetical protein CFC21_033695 [Triticum aestivum]|uniref:Secreted protein n=2 Tax=Triticum aestivum TaxID=4565 RepID=A0A9R1JKB4_WHEAT|nr:hypothetical protein CFC21_033695 [Triticum aestivum]